MKIELENVALEGMFKANATQMLKTDVR